ncbi:MAG TPA: type III PLP-dependent enzyme [Streptosporangiaceae bacterium]|jgi:diaminopimelate decarboxylase
MFGTPVYLYDCSEVRSAHAGLRRALPGASVLYYSLKANPHPDLAAVLARLGCRVEVSSVGEIETALRAGFAASDVLMTGPGKTCPDIGYALRCGVRRFSVDSPGDLERVGTLAREHGCEVECLLRVNAGQPVAGLGLTMTGTASQFGADASWVLAEPERFRAAHGARATGLHLYMGTNIEEPSVLAAALSASIELAGRLSPVLGSNLREVDLGGGFGLPYARRGRRPDYAGLAAELEPALDANLPGWRHAEPLVSFESGRYLVGGCGTLVCRVIDVKRSKGRTFIILDSGVHHLGGMSGLRRLPRVVPELVADGNSAGPLMHDCVVTGPLCTPLDTWSDGVDLPRLRPGDVVAVPNVGAYGLTASLIAFLGHPAAVEVTLDGDQVISASRVALERVPVALVQQAPAVNER